MVGGNESLIYGINNFTIGNTVTYKVDKYTESKDNLVVKVGNVTVATRSNVTGSSVGELTRTISFTSDELTKIYNAMPKVTKATFLFTITSYVDNANMGSTSTTATGTLPTSMKPTLTRINLTESVSGIASKFGGYVKNKSKLNYSYTSTNATGATTSSYNLTIDGGIYTDSSGVTNVIKTSGDVSYSAYVIDSRGRKSDVLKGTISVLDYTAPKITTFKVIRCDSQGNESNEGLYAKYIVNTSISPVNNKNNKSFVIDYKLQENDTWTTWKTYTSSYTLNETSAVLKITDSAYHFRVTATDYFDNPNKIYSLSSTFVLFELTEDIDGISWGATGAESDTFNIAFSKTNLSKATYIGGQNEAAEKNIYFKNPDDSQYAHNSKVYGGNATSPVAIGMWDGNKSSPIFQYFDGDDYRFKFGDDIKLRWGNYDIEAVLTKVFASLSGRYRTKEGLLVQWGTTSIAGGAGQPTSQDITFPISYDEIPFIVESLVSTVPGTTVLGSGHGSDSISGTTLYVTRTNTANTSLRWLAIGIKEV